MILNKLGQTIFSNQNFQILVMHVSFEKLSPSNIFWIQKFKFNEEGPCNVLSKAKDNEAWKQISRTLDKTTFEIFESAQRLFFCDNGFETRHISTYDVEFFFPIFSFCKVDKPNLIFGIQSYSLFSSKRMPMYAKLCSAVKNVSF